MFAYVVHVHISCTCPLILYKSIQNDSVHLAVSLANRLPTFRKNGMLSLPECRAVSRMFMSHICAVHLKTPSFGRSRSGYPAARRRSVKRTKPRRLAQLHIQVPGTGRTAHVGVCRHEDTEYCAAVQLVCHWYCLAHQWEEALGGTETFSLSTSRQAA